MKRFAPLMVAFFCGLVFAVGLGLSGMTQPTKVTGFLDFAGSWDPSLAFVMVGAILVYSVGYRLIVREPKPILCDSFALPSSTRIDKRLLLGSALFGVGWGLSGYCPGPSLVSSVAFQSHTLIFVVAMIAGMKLGSR